MSAALPSTVVADGHRTISLAALMATYMQAVNISLPNAALPHIQGTLSMANDEVLLYRGERRGHVDDELACGTLWPEDGLSILPRRLRAWSYA